MNTKFWTDELKSKWIAKAKGLNGANNYRFKSESFAGSYGDYARMYSEYLHFKRNPNFWHWTQVHLTSGHVSNLTELPTYETDNINKPYIGSWDIMQSAAYISMLIGDKTTALIVLDSIHTQMNYAHADFSNAIWLQDNYSDVHPVFWIAKAYNIAFLAMIFIDEFVTSTTDKAKQTFILNIFENAADFFAEELNLNLNIYFSNRGLSPSTPRQKKVESLTVTGGNTATGTFAHNGSANLWTLNKTHNNRRAEMVLFCFFMGMEKNNTYHLNTSIQYYKEFFAFSIFPNYFAEMERSTTSDIQKGFAYCAQNLIILSVMAYIQHLHGSDELLQYSTYHGVNGSATTAPTQKDLRYAIDLFRKYFNGSFVYYINGQSPNSTYLLDGVSGTYIVWHDVLAACLLYHLFGDTTLLNQAKRIGSDFTTVNLTLANTANFGGFTLARYIVPAPMFMFLDN